MRKTESEKTGDSTADHADEQPMREVEAVTHAWVRGAEVQRMEVEAGPAV